MRTTHYLKPSLPKPYSANASRMLRVVMTSRALLYRREQRHGRVKVLLQSRQKKQCSLTGLYNRETRVKAALLEVIENRTAGFVFDANHTGVTEHVLRTAFEKACGRAEIPFGLMVEGDLIWHDLRRTFATELRERQVHEYDIADLLGHHIQAVTGTYARSTPCRSDLKTRMLLGMRSR